MATASAAEIRVVDVERSRFEVLVDGEVAGFTEYRRRPGLIAFTHTLIDPRFEGHGLGSHWSARSCPKRVSRACRSCRSARSCAATSPATPSTWTWCPKKCDQRSSSPPMADSASTRKRYTGQAVDVSFDSLRCRHAAECVRGLASVFDTRRRPWILPDGGDPEDVVRVVARCPTGALRTHPRRTTASEQPVIPTEVTALPGGPVLLRGDLHVTGPGGGDEHETRAALCSCGATANVPYCDGSGTCADWPHPRSAQ